MPKPHKQIDTHQRARAARDKQTTFRPATRADLVRFYGQAPPMTVRAWVAVNGDDRPLAVGGYYLSGGVAVAFTNNREEMTKRDRVRAGRFVVDKLKELGMEVVAGAGLDGDTAMKHFGFVPHGMFWRLNGDV